MFHVPGLARALGEAHRVLRPGGRIAFTDWIAHEPLSAADEQLLWNGMAAATLINGDRHAQLLRGAGFEIESMEDETNRWGFILAERLRMYRTLRGEAEQAGAPAGHDDSCKSYVLFVWCNRRSWVAPDLLQSNPADARPVKRLMQPHLSAVEGRRRGGSPSGGAASISSLLEVASRGGARPSIPIETIVIARNSQLTDRQWAAIEPMLPNNTNGPHK